MPVQPNTWILVADAGRAHLFTSGAHGEPWAIVEDFVHPEGRMRGADLGSDRPGRVQQRGGVSRSAMEPHTDIHEVENKRFADTLCDRLLAGLREGSYRQIVLVAAPHFLGLLRGGLDPQVARHIAASVPADLTRVAEHELPAQVLAHLE